MIAFSLPILAGATKPLTGTNTGPFRATAFDVVIVVVFLSVIGRRLLGSSGRARFLHFAPLSLFVMLGSVQGGPLAVSLPYVAGLSIAAATCTVVTSLKWSSELRSTLLRGWVVAALMQLVAAVPQTGLQRGTGLCRFPNELGLFSLGALASLLRPRVRDYLSLPALAIGVSASAGDLILSGGRATFLAAIVVVAAVTGRVLKRAPHRMFAFSGLAVVAGAGVYVLPKTSSVSVQRIASASRNIGTLSSSFHVDNWRAGVKLVGSHPVGGVGFANALVRSSVFAGSFEIHNSIISIAAMTGLVGSLTLVWVLWTIWRVCANRNTQTTYVAAVVLAALVAGMFQYEWNSRAIWLAVLVLLVSDRPRFAGARLQ